MKASNFNKLLDSLSPDELPQLTIAEPDERACKRIRRLVNRRISDSQKPEKRQSLFSSPNYMRILCAACAVVVFMLGTFLVYNKPMRDDFVRALSAIFTDTEPTLETTLPDEIGEKSAFRSTDGKFTITDVDIVSEKYSQPKVTLHIVGAGEGSGLLLCRDLRVLIDGKPYFEIDGWRLEDSYNAILAGDILAELDRDGFDISFGIDSSKLTAKSCRLEIASLWSADFVGERGEELVTTELGENIAIDFTLPDEPTKLPTAYSYNPSYTTKDEFRLKSITILPSNKDTELGFHFEGKGRDGQFLLGKDISLTSNGKVIYEFRGYEPDKSFNAVLAGDILDVIDEYGFDLSMKIDTENIRDGKLTLELGSLWSTELVGEKLEEAVSTPIGENLVFEITIKDGEITEFNVPKKAPEAVETDTDTTAEPSSNSSTKLIPPEPLSPEELRELIISDNYAIEGGYWSDTNWTRYFLYMYGSDTGWTTEHLYGFSIPKLADGYELHAGVWHVEYADISQNLLALEVTHDNKQYLSALQVYEGDKASLRASDMVALVDTDPRFTGIFKYTEPESTDTVTVYNLSKGENPELDEAYSRKLELTSPDGRFGFEYNSDGDLFLTDSASGESTLIQKANLGYDVQAFRQPSGWRFVGNTLYYQIYYWESAGGVHALDCETGEKHTYSRNNPLGLYGRYIYTFADNYVSENPGVFCADESGEVPIEWIGHTPDQDSYMCSPLLNEKTGELHLLDTDKDGVLRYCLYKLDGPRAELVRSEVLYNRTFSPQYLSISYEKAVISGERHAGCDDYIYVIEPLANN